MKTVTCQKEPVLSAVVKTKDQLFRIVEKTVNLSMIENRKFSLVEAMSAELTNV